MPLLDTLELIDQVGRRRQRNLLGGQHFERFADRIDLFDVDCPQHAHHRALVGHTLDQADALERDDRLAHQVALDAVTRRQLLFDQPLARLQPAEHDLLLDHVRQGARSRL